ncbi:MAG TPA: acyltransferase, partial [Pseudobdellovibrionaceae bacterium]
MLKYGFGTWRFFLAFLVAISHLYANMIHGPAAYAVWGFYVLSGYLMTYVLTTKYSFTVKGLQEFAFNRFLRIFPGYWIVTILGVITILVLKDQVSLTTLNPQFQLPNNFNEWLFVVTLLPVFPNARLPVPVASALGIEVGAYILMPFLAASRSASWLVLIISFIIHAQFDFIGDTFAVRYATFLPCLFPFAAGSLICHYRLFLLKFAAPKLSTFVWLAQCLIWLSRPYYPWTYGLYISVALSAWVTLSLSNIKTGKLDSHLGELSYPVYLLHTTAAAWLLPSM